VKHWIFTLAGILGTISCVASWLANVLSSGSIFLSQVFDPIQYWEFVHHIYLKVSEWGTRTPTY